MLETYSVAFSIYIPLLASENSSRFCITCFLLKPRL